jgi:hypothetical protein
MFGTINGLRASSGAHATAPGAAAGGREDEDGDGCEIQRARRDGDDFPVDDLPDISSADQWRATQADY